MCRARPSQQKNRGVAPCGMYMPQVLCQRLNRTLYKKRHDSAGVFRCLVKKRKKKEKH